MQQLLTISRLVLTLVITNNAIFLFTTTVMRFTF